MEAGRAELTLRARRRAAGGLGLAAALSAACATHGGGKPPTGPVRLGHVTAQVRSEYIRRSAVWQPIQIASLDLKLGPQGKGAFEPGQHLTCDYVEPEGPPSGNTPKFQCDLGGGDVVKIKYGKHNHEVFSEVAASRLYWALGFGADHMYPVEVTCRNCPIEPWYWRSERKVDLTTFELASVERKFPGEGIESPGHDGWIWPELDRVDERAGGAPRAHRDALKLLTAIIQDSDNKESNQRLSCLPEGVVRDEAGNESCTKPFMLVQDLGLSFGKSTTLNSNKLGLGAWSGQSVWRDPRQCVANLKKSRTATLSDPRIGEAGRKFLAGLLAQLSDTQVHDIFAVARFDRLDEKIHTAEGERSVTIDDWVQAFKKKRDEVASVRCPP